jgi:membrane associated rhomboid family serine protease
VVFAMIFIIPDLGIGLLFIPGTIPGWLFALLFVGFSIFASMRGGGRINHDAHLWGALSGVLLTIMLNPQTATNFIQWLN